MRRSLLQFMPREPSLVGAAYAGAAALVAAATLGAWWGVHSHETRAVREASAQRGDAIAAALRDQVAAKIGSNDFGAVRALLADLAASQGLAAARVTLGDGTVIVDGREPASAAGKLPASWPSSANSASDGPTRRAVVDVAGKGPLVIEINAGEPSGAMTDLEFIILSGGAWAVVGTLARPISVRCTFERPVPAAATRGTACSTNSQRCGSVAESRKRPSVAPWRA